MAASTLSLGMLRLRLFCTARRSAGLEFGSGPPALTAMLMSLAMRANCLAMRSQRANIVCLRTSKMRPIGRGFWQKNRESPDFRGSARGFAHRDGNGADVGVTGRHQVPLVRPIAP